MNFQEIIFRARETRRLDLAPEETNSNPNSFEIGGGGGARVSSDRSSRVTATGTYTYIELSSIRFFFFVFTRDVSESTEIQNHTATYGKSVSRTHGDRPTREIADLRPRWTFASFIGPP